MTRFVASSVETVEADHDPEALRLWRAVWLYGTLRPKTDLPSGPPLTADDREGLDRLLAQATAYDRDRNV